MAMKAGIYRSRTVNMQVEWAAFAFLCLASLLLGFSLSREALDIAMLYNSRFTAGPSSSVVPQTHQTQTQTQAQVGIGVGGRVHVGRHQILIRKWPHPNPLQTVAAHRLIDLLQKEQRLVNNQHRHVQRLLVVTPVCFHTAASSVNVAHLVALAHTLRSVPYPLTWIVVDGGGDGISHNETASLLSKSHLPYFHLVSHRIITSCKREDLEPQLRMAGLRFIREQRLDGIILFADEGNTYSLEFFDEVQKVEWAGALSFALLETIEMDIQTQQRAQHVSIHGPACNSTGHLSGWHISAPNTNNNNNCCVSMEKMKKRRLEWMGIVMNAKVLMDDVYKPSWIREWHERGGIGSTQTRTPLNAIKDEAYIQPLGRCGQDVLLWCLG